MKSSVALLACLVVPAFADDPRGDHPDASPSTPAEERAMFHLPPGFEIQLVAAEPEIQKPLNLTFDAAGRLWVTGSEMYPWPAGTDAQGKPIPNFAKAYDDIAGAFGARGNAPAPSDKARDTIRVLSDFDETGHARKISVFADGLNIPSGVQPLPREVGAKGDTVIAYSIPNIYRFEDTDGDGRADTRDVLYGTAGFLDTHGGMSSFLYWIDGWIYGTHGFRNHSELRDKSGRVTVLDSGNTYRFRPDGSAFEIFTHGQTNPFGLTVDPLGNFYTADSHSKPVYMLLQGGYYEGIGKQHDGLGFAPRITDDDHGSTSIAGIAYYADDKFPEDYRGNLFNGNPVTRCINRDKLEWHGSTPKAIRQPDFLTSDDPWFRPVQVKLGPDGALYIADFYNPIIGHYEFPLADPRRDHSHGRIWRIVYRGENMDAPLQAMPDLTKLANDGLLKKLADPNLVVRTLATNELVDHVGKNAVASVREGDSSEDSGQASSNRKAFACWALERLGTLDEQQVANSGVFGPECKPMEQSDLFRNQEIRILTDRSQLSEATVKHAQEELLSLFPNIDPSDFKPFTARSLVELLGKHSASKNVEVLIAFWLGRPDDDTELIHLTRMALRDNLIASNGYVAATPLAATDPKAAEKIAEISLAVKTPEAADFLLGHLKRSSLSAARSGEFLRHTILYLPQDRLGGIADLLEIIKDAPVSQRLDMAGNIAQAFRQRGVPLPESVATWIQRNMLEALSSTDENLLNRAIENLRETTLDSKLGPLAKIAGDATRSEAIRIASFEALANASGSDEILAKALNDAGSLNLRKRVAEILGRNGGGDSSAILLTALPNAPGELAAVIAVRLAQDDDLCAQLLSTIEHGKAPAALLRNTLVAAALEKRAKPLRDRAASLTADLPPEDTRLDQVIAERVAAYDSAKPDSSHGAQVFAQQCAICHRLGNTGANIGPALDGIGARGLHRIAEDILDPNRNVDPMFRQTVIESNDGQSVAGLNVREEGVLLLVTDSNGKTVSVPKAAVKSQTTSKLSLMPATFETAFPANDFQDLLAYLLGSSIR